MSTSPRNSPIRVLIVEDEPDLQESLASYLNMEGMAADGVASLRGAENWMLTHHYDILILDLGLPDGDGLQWLERRIDLRDKGIIITTARGHGIHRISGVKAGADAYLVKPVEFEELTALIHNLIRRMRQDAASAWELNTVNWVLKAPGGHEIKLTHSENTLLSCLAKSPGQAIDRDVLVEALGYDPRIYDLRRMEILVRRLRHKVRAALGYALPLGTVHRCGYAFAAPITVGPCRQAELE